MISLNIYLPFSTWIKVIGPRLIDFTNDRFFSCFFNAVGRSIIKNMMSHKHGSILKNIDMYMGSQVGQAQLHS